MPSYPHMLAEDTEVWSRYLAAPVAPIKDVWYDVHVGGAVTPVEEADLLGARIAAGITRKRIDVIAAVGGGYWVIEVKPFGSMLAVGQISSYTRLFVREYAPDGETWPVIVCDNADPDVTDLCEDLGVVLIEV